MSKQFLCMDVGGTNTRVGVVNEQLEVLGSAIERTPELAAKGIGVGLCDLALRWVELAKAEGGSIEGVIIGVPATVDASCRVVLQAPNVEGLTGLPLADLVEQTTGIPTMVEKDVNLLILSDIYSLGIDAASTVCGVYFGTGIGNALYLGGRVWHGAHGSAGELGHVPALGRTEVCGCGNPGCLECFGGGHHLASVVTEHYPKTPIGRAFADLAGTPEVEEVLEAMAIAVAAEANIIDPDEVIIGGGLPLMEGFDREAFGKRVYTNLRKPYPAETLELRYSRQGQLSGLIGGAICLSR